MTAPETVAALAALAHETRLEVFRRLVQRGPEGLSAGTLARDLSLLPSSLTFHLRQLIHARLITQRRAGRQLFYATDFAAMNAVLFYLTENCCGGGVAQSSLCRPGSTAGEPAETRRSA